MQLDADNDTREADERVNSVDRNTHALIDQVVRLEAELVNLVYGCTKIPSEGHLPVWQRPAFWACVVGAVFIALNLIFW